MALLFEYARIIAYIQQFPEKYLTQTRRRRENHENRPSKDLVKHVLSKQELFANTAFYERSTKACVEIHVKMH